MTFKPVKTGGWACDDASQACVIITRLDSCKDSL